MALKVTIGPRQPTYAKDLGNGHATIDTKWFDSAPEDPAKESDVELTLTMNGKPYTFRQVGAYGHPNEDKNVPAVDGRRPPSITITGTTSAGGQVTMIMGFEMPAFRPAKVPVKAFGVVFEGSIAWFIAKAVMNPMGLTFVEATTTFEKASMEKGEPIQATMDFKIMKFAGGKSPTVKWEE